MVRPKNKSRMTSIVQRSPMISREQATGQGERRVTAAVLGLPGFDFAFAMAIRCHTSYLRTTSNNTCIVQVLWHCLAHERNLSTAACPTRGRVTHP